MPVVHNARVTLLANALSSVGIGTILAGIIGPVITGRVADVSHMLLWFLIGADLIAIAQIVPGELRA